MSYRRTLERHLPLAMAPDRVEQLIRASFPGIETCDKCRDKTIDGLGSALGLTPGQACELSSRLTWIMGQFRCNDCDEYCRVLYRRLPLATTLGQVEQVMESFPRRETCRKCREAIDDFRSTYDLNLSLDGYVSAIEEGYMRYCKAERTSLPQLPPRPLDEEEMPSPKTQRTPLPQLPSRSLQEEKPSFETQRKPLPRLPQVPPRSLEEEMPSPKTQRTPLPDLFPFLPLEEKKPPPKTQRKPLPRLPQLSPRSLEEEIPSPNTQRTPLPQLPPRSPPATSEPEKSRAPTLTHAGPSRNRTKEREGRAERRARWQQEGVCTTCGRERDSHFKMCNSCRSLWASRHRRRAAESPAGEAPPPRVYLRPKLKEARDQRRREGVCTGCGRERDDSNLMMCEHCRGISFRSKRRRRQKRKQPSPGDQEETEIDETADTGIQDETEIDETADT
ncbi:hypothetical protein BJ166DRAFT_91343 [Pestalotiopsis sp. NC0098]|nr:hypothetical protein BJ166DRAFT_91343 [Pestalotiopsis sp. NC0098]